jgi:hypothetical protein
MSSLTADTFHQPLRLTGEPICRLTCRELFPNLNAASSIFGVSLQTRQSKSHGHEQHTSTTMGEQGAAGQPQWLLSLFHASLTLQPQPTFQRSPPPLRCERLVVRRLPRVMQPNGTNKPRTVRIAPAVFGIVLLAMLLPSTGGIIDGPPRHGMWRFGPFLFHPDGVLLVIGLVVIPTLCATLGRSNTIRSVGWILLVGVLFLTLSR